MTTFALLNDGQIVETFTIEAGGSDTPPIEERFHPDFVARLVDISTIAPQPKIGWRTADGGRTFSPTIPLLHTPAEVRAAKIALVQTFMDDKARELNYDDIATAVTYADEPSVPKFQTEGQRFREWRSVVWAKCYEILNAVDAGQRVAPSDQDLFAELPRISTAGLAESTSS